MAESDNLHDENDFKNVHLISRDKVINSLENYLELNPCSAANEDFMRIKQILSGIYNKYLQIFKSNQKNKRSQFEIRISKLSEDYNKRMNDNFIKFENQSQLDNFHDKTKRQIKKNFIDECESEPCEELDAFLIKLSKLIDDDKRDFEILFRIDIENKREMHKRIKSDIRQFYNDEMDKFIKNEYFIGIKEFFQNHKTVFKNTIDKYQEKLNLSGKNISEFVKEAISDIFIKIQEENILKQPQESPAIGIDLGTTNSCVTYFDSNIRSDNVLVIPNEFGNKTTPSIVSFRDKNIIITGDAAKDDIHQYSENTVKSAKRLIGREFGDLSVQSHIKTCSYKVIENQNHNPMISVKVDGKEHNFKPEEISSHILGQMKKIAENHLGRAVNKAVITVPAYFNDSQRKSTIEAGKLAGLEVLRIIDEPTAAAIAFRMDRTIKETRTILVFDFGGGTLDVSILKITKGVIEVIAKGGDNILGGDDFDSNLSEYCLKEFKNQYKIEIKGTELPAAISRLRTECEKHKKRLSFCESTTLSISYFYKKYDLKVLLTRDKFEEINYHLFIKSMNLVTTTLEDKQIPTSDIDDIVLVGGSTRIPKIRELLSQIFGGRPLDHSVNPDEAVAKGAGIQAALLNGSQSYGLEELELREKTSHSLGIKADIGVVQHKLSIMIPRYTNIPTEITGMYYTTQDTQTTALIEIYEGEKEMAKDNHLLGKFYMKNIPVVKGTKQSIAVTFRIDKEGLLKVKAKLVTTGEENEIEITEKRFGWDGPGNE